MSPALTFTASRAAGSAVFSECGRYRYLLTRRISAGDGRCLFIMLNPSTADAERDDPTIRRCVGFARRWRMSELRVVNLFAWRATEPSGLGGVMDPVGPANDETIRMELDDADMAVAAWGDHGRLDGRADQMRTLLSPHRGKVWHLGLNRSGEPRHPLYAPAATVLSPLPI